MKTLLLLAVLLLASPAWAQQAPDASFMTKIVAVLQQQRNAATDREAQAQAQAAALADEIATLKARVAELEKAAEPPKN